MKTTRRLSLVLLTVVATGCYHQVVSTGLTPSATVVDKPFVPTWLWGIVPAGAIDVHEQCKSGVAVIVTEQSFVNGLVSVITLGIFTPQHVQVTCASGSASLPRNAAEVMIPTNTSLEERVRLLDSAVTQSLKSHRAVVVRF